MDFLRPVSIATLVFLAFATPALALEIISPADGTILAKTTRLVIKGGDKPPLDGITIKVNSEKSDLIDISSAAYRQSFKDFVFLEAEYDPGVNQIEVEGYAAGKRVATAKVKVFLPTGVVEPPAPFAPSAFHTAEREAMCNGCHHKLNPSVNELANPVPGQNPCSSCHLAITNGKYVHGPTGVFDCVACHDTKSQPVKYAVPDNEGKFCVECHEDTLPAGNKAAFVHGPVAAWLCLTCHSPHASDAPGILREASVNKSCNNCHDDVEKRDHVVRTTAGGGHPLEGKRDPARPGKTFHCASCHDPHIGKIATLLRYEAANAYALCRSCHKK